jgi:hypothetical protein
VAGHYGPASNRLLLPLLHTFVKRAEKPMGDNELYEQMCNKTRCSAISIYLLNALVAGYVS